MALQDKKLNYVTRLIEADEALIDVLDSLQALRREWDANGYSTTITDDDLTGDVDHVSAAMLGSFFYSVSEVLALLNAGHNANLYGLTR